MRPRGKCFDDLCSLSLSFNNNESRSHLLNTYLPVRKWSLEQSSRTLDKPLPLSVPQFPFLRNGTKDSTPLRELQ